VQRWHATSTLTSRVRGAIRSNLLTVGRWLAAEHPEAADPTGWTRQTCAAWIAALDRMSVGDFAQRIVGLKDRSGKPLRASTKATQLAAVRTFFRDRQECAQGARCPAGQAVRRGTGRWLDRTADRHRLTGRIRRSARPGSPATSPADASAPATGRCRWRLPAR
jgi:hypothetical protein